MTASIGYLGDRMIQEVRIMPSGGEGRVISYGSGSRKNGTENFAISTTANPTITVELIDIYGYKYNISKTLIQ